MPLDLPVLRLGLAGFTPDQQARIEQHIGAAGTPGIGWAPGPFAEADAWWINGARTQLLADGTLRVAGGLPDGRSLHLNLDEVDRPLAFAEPLAPRRFDPAFRFDPACAASMDAVLDRFEAWLQPAIAQDCLAAQILEQETALGSGVYDVTAGGVLLAIVNLRGEIAVLPTAQPAQYDDAMWTPRPLADARVPEGFVRTSLSQVMWHYAVRTSRDLLPRRYRRGPIYFRRPPRLPHRQLRDIHLLMLRELAAGPASFDELSHRTGVAEAPLAQALAALYLVGSITANPKRAGATGQDTRGGAGHSIAPSSFNTRPDTIAPPAWPGGRPDLTAPAPLRLE